MAKYKCRRLDGSTKKYRNKIESYSEACEIASDLGLTLQPTGWFDLYRPVTAFDYLVHWARRGNRHPDLNNGDGMIYVIALDQSERRYTYEADSERCPTYVIDVNSVLE